MRFLDALKTIVMMRFMHTLIMLLSASGRLGCSNASSRICARSRQPVSI